MILGRLTALRPVEEEDLPFLQSMMNDQEIAHLVGGFGFPVSLAAQREWFQRARSNARTQRWIVVERDGETPLGMTGLWDIDWHSRSALTALKLARAAKRGKGLGTDAIRTVVAYAFDQVGLHRLWSEILVYNEASRRAYVDKVGFRIEGTNKQAVFKDGVFHDQFRIAMLAEEYRSNADFDGYRATPGKGGSR